MFTYFNLNGLITYSLIIVLIHSLSNFSYSSFLSLHALVDSNVTVRRTASHLLILFSPTSTLMYVFHWAWLHCIRNRDPLVSLGSKNMYVSYTYYLWRYWWYLWFVCLLKPYHHVYGIFISSEPCFCSILYMFRICNLVFSVISIQECVRLKVTQGCDGEYPSLGCHDCCCVLVTWSGEWQEVLEFREFNYPIEWCLPN